MDDILFVNSDTPHPIYIFYTRKCAGRIHPGNTPWDLCVTVQSSYHSGWYKPSPSNLSSSYSLPIPDSKLINVRTASNALTALHKETNTVVSTFDMVSLLPYVTSITSLLLYSVPLIINNNILLIFLIAISVHQPFYKSHIRPSRLFCTSKLFNRSKFDDILPFAFYFSAKIDLR